MARPRQFNEAAALDAAMHCFWTHGYQLTSVRDLARQMGMTGASLYNAFGDKRALYRRALDQYFRLSIHDRIARLQRLPPRQALTAFFSEIIERSMTARHGCMLVNATLELPSHDDTLRDVLVREMTVIEAFFRGHILVGQRNGTITRSTSAQELARMLLSVLLGIRVLARTQPPRHALQAAAEAALALLQPQAISATKTPPRPVRPRPPLASARNR